LTDPGRQPYAAYERLRAAIAPAITYSQTEYEKLLFGEIPAGCRWLDLGCGHSLLPEWRTEEEARLTARAAMLVGVDPDATAVRRHQGLHHRIVGLGDALPLASGSMDVVSANMVVEHLADPSQVFREVARVLRAGGRFILHTPNARGYPTLAARMLPEFAKKRLAALLHGRAEEDVYPTFYRANTPQVLGRIAVEAGFRSSRVLPICSEALLATVPVVRVAELMLLRMLSSSAARSWRPNLLAVLTR
jgi:SAM-dependent methyltransferase